MSDHQIRQWQRIGLLLTVAAAVAVGCTTTVGRYVPNSQFVYPNSNVQILGPVKAEYSKTSFLVMPQLNPDDIRATYQKALSQVQGANVLVNFKEDTAFTSVLMFNTIHYTLEGQAAKMEVGKKELK